MRVSSLGPPALSKALGQWIRGERGVHGQYDFAERFGAVAVVWHQTGPAAGFREVACSSRIRSGYYACSPLSTLAFSDGRKKAEEGGVEWSEQLNEHPPSAAGNNDARARDSRNKGREAPLDAPSCEKRV